MGDMSEYYAEWRKHMKDHKAEKAIAGATVLTEAGIEWYSHNNGVHLIVHQGAKQINFWPSTGLWMFQGSKFRRHGVESLINYIKSSAP